MSRAVLLVALAALAGCASAAQPTPREACETAVDADPTVKEDLAKASENLNWQFQYQPKYQADRQDALTRCLQSHGVIRRGGVERQKQQ